MFIKTLLDVQLKQVSTPGIENRILVEASSFVVFIHFDVLRILVDASFLVVWMLMVRFDVLRVLSEASFFVVLVHFVFLRGPLMLLSSSYGCP